MGSHRGRPLCQHPPLLTQLRQQQQRRLLALVFRKGGKVAMVGGFSTGSWAHEQKRYMRKIKPITGIIIIFYGRVCHDDIMAWSAPGPHPLWLIPSPSLPQYSERNHIKPSINDFQSMQTRGTTCFVTNQMDWLTLYIVYFCEGNYE